MREKHKWLQWAKWPILGHVRARSWDPLRFPTWVPGIQVLVVPDASWDTHWQGAGIDNKAWT